MGAYVELLRTRQWIKNVAVLAALPFGWLEHGSACLGWVIIAFGAFVIVGSSNTVNLTDGLDGLAIVPVMIAAAAFVLIAYLVGNVIFADYLQLHYVAGTGELVVLLGALIGELCAWWRFVDHRVRVKIACANSEKPSLLLSMISSAPAAVACATFSSSSTSATILTGSTRVGVMGCLAG